MNDPCTLDVSNPRTRLFPDALPDRSTLAVVVDAEVDVEQSADMGVMDGAVGVGEGNRITMRCVMERRGR